MAFKTIRIGNTAIRSVTWTKVCTKMLRKAQFQLNLSESLREAASREMLCPPDQTRPPQPKGSGNLIISPDNFLVLCHGICVIGWWQLFFPEWDM